MYIILMIIANLIGFGMGHNDLYSIMWKIMDEASCFFLLKVIIYLIPSVIVMFYVREKEEQKSKNKIKF